MTQKTFPFQPGAMLHGALLGAFRASGSNFGRCCATNGVTVSAARNVTFGISKGPHSQQLLARMIKDAGPEIVEAGYLNRLKKHNDIIKNVGAA